MSHATKWVAFVVVWWSLILGTSFLLADEPVSFDVPVIVEACKVPSEMDGSRERIVEIVIPVSTMIDSEFRDAIKEFNFQVHWNRNVYPLVDYAPRTQMGSNIDGLISVERRREQGVSLGTGGSGKVDTLVNLNANVGADQRNSETFRFQQIPDQDILVASGTVQRGTGAFFRFHPSKQISLEGGRDLIVSFRVPDNWRAGVLKVVCEAEGKKPGFAGLGASVKTSQSFIVPVYLKSDYSARDVAVQYVQRELDLRRSWTKYRERLEPTNVSWASRIESQFGGKSDYGLPTSWADQLIHSGSDKPLIKFERSLPDDLRDRATEFAQSRQQLYQLSR